MACKFIAKSNCCKIFLSAISIWLLHGQLWATIRRITSLNWCLLQWSYLFPVINHNHLNSDETKQNLIHLLFFVLLNHQTNYWLLLLRMTFAYKIKEEQKNKCMSNIWYNFNGKVNIKMKSLKKLHRKYIILPLKRLTPIPCFHSIFINYWIPPL